MKAIIIFAAVLLATAAHAADEALPDDASAAQVIKKAAPTVPPPILDPVQSPAPHDPLREMPPRKIAEDSSIKMEFHGEFRTTLGITNMQRLQE